ncbi:MAG: hypothetical protein L0191_18670 [Acidobacteria bacterium]|nr:hypothetical protein [Acidobacteriota bacterium]MCI0657269.1 hypothetical protein [Acidobacteriota bacterium]
MVVAREEGARGVAVAATARALGLRPRTLGLWLKHDRRPRLRRVEVTASPEVRVEQKTRGTLFTPQGYRVEGLEHAALVRLLRELR